PEVTSASWIAARSEHAPPLSAHTPFPGLASTLSTVVFTVKTGETKRTTLRDAPCGLLLALLEASMSARNATATTRAIRLFTIWPLPGSKHRR
ncbi:MAG TPA: hypothetical protein VF321_02395, partial [Gaiellaceae bacterium]